MEFEGEDSLPQNWILRALTFAWMALMGLLGAIVVAGLVYVAGEAALRDVRDGRVPGLLVTVFSFAAFAAALTLGAWLIATTAEFGVRVWRWPRVQQWVAPTAKRVGTVVAWFFVGAMAFVMFAFMAGVAFLAIALLLGVLGIWE